MNRFEGKYAALLAVIFSLPNLVLFIVVQFLSEFETGPELFWGIGIAVVLFTFLSLIAYTVEGIQAVIRAIRHRWGWKDLILNIVLAILIFGLFPMLYMDCWFPLPFVDSIWFCIYYGVVFAVEVFSLTLYYRNNG